MVLMLAISANADFDRVGIYSDLAGTTCSVGVSPFVATTLYVVAHIPNQDSGITGAEFKVDNWPGDPGYPEGDITLTILGDSSSGDIASGLVVSWDGPTGSSEQTVTIATIVVLPYSDTWIGSNYEMTVVASESGALQLFDESESPFTVLGDHFTCNCSSDCDCLFFNESFPIAPDVFNIRIDIEKDNNSNIHDNENYAGYSVDATDGYDPEVDQPEPPLPPESYVSLYFHHPEWNSPFGDRFHTDIRGYSDLIGETLTWDFQFETDITDEQFDLEFHFDNSHEDQTFPITLLDLDNPQYYDLTTNGQNIYENSEDGIRHFRLYLGPVYGSLQSSTHFDPGWTLFSLPLHAFNWTQSWILGDDLVNQYYIYYHNHYGYYGTPGNLGLGEGYWLGLVTESNIDVSGRLREFHTTSLQAGWHVVGSGLNTSIQVSDIMVSYGSDVVSWAEAVSSGWVSPAVFGYNQATGDYELVDTLNPWDAVWFGVLNNTRTFRFDVFERDRDANDAAEFTPSWVFPFQLRSASGAVVTKAEIGIDTRSSSGFDPAFDYPSPPNRPNSSNDFVGFVHNSWATDLGSRFVRDIRNLHPDSDSCEWTIEVDASEEGSLLTWDLIDTQVPHDIQLSMRSLDSGTEHTIDLRESSFVNLDRSGTFRFEIQASREHDDGPIHAETKLHSNFPNPFNPVTTLPLYVDSPSKIKLAVVDVAGRLIRELHEGYLDQGPHEFIWDGTDTLGQPVSSGIYFSVLSVDEDTFTQKMLLLK
jgi:hypothetical protein